MLCGRFGSAFGDYPAIGAVVVARDSASRGKLPPYVAIPRNPSFTWELGKSAFLGGRYESFKTGDPNAADFKVQDVTPAETSDRQHAPAPADACCRPSTAWPARSQGNDQIATYDEFQQRAAALILSSDARSAFAIEQESDRLRDRYGRNTFGQSCLLARRLIERGVRFVTVNYGGWDHHAKIWDGLDQQAAGVRSGLLGPARRPGHAAACWPRRWWLVYGEFGRTPKINKDAGRDHWAPAGVAAVRRRRRARRPGDRPDRQAGRFITRRPVAPADVACTVYEALGIDPRKSPLRRMAGPSRSSTRVKTSRNFINLTTEARRHRDNKCIVMFSLCLCASVVSK